MPATSSVSPSGNKYVDGILTGVKWATTSLTFSFPSSASYYGSGYGHGEPGSNFQAFNAAQQAAVKSIYAIYSSVANLTFHSERARRLPSMAISALLKRINIAQPLVITLIPLQPERRFVGTLLKLF